MCVVLLYLLSALLAGPLLMGCDVDKVDEVGWSDVPCFPYGANFYEGTYTFDGVGLNLAVETVNSRCCVLSNSTWPYTVSLLTETELVISLEGEPEEVFIREPGTAGDIVGLWTREEQTFDFQEDGSYTGTDDPRCLEPVDCGAVPFTRSASPQRALAALLPLLLPAVLILFRRMDMLRFRKR